MSFNLKTYKRLKIKHYLKKINFFFFFHGTSLKNTNWIKIEQFLKLEKLKYFRILNTLMVQTVKNSTFKNLAALIHGPILLLHTTNEKLVLKNLNNLGIWVSLLCLKLNNKIYSKKQITNLKKLSYVANVHLLYNSIRFIVKIPCSKLRNKKITQVSK